MMIVDNDWNRIRNLTNSLNLKVFNFLSTHQFYVDTLPSTFNSIYGENSSEYNIIDKKISEEYDSNLSYRVICAIRNHVQHYGLPIHAIMKTKELIQTNDSEKIKYYIQLVTQITSLERNKKFKKKILNELRDTFGHNIDFMLIIRNYLESIGKIHYKIREILKPNLDKWDKIIMDTINNDKEKYLEYKNYKGLYATKNLNYKDNDNTINLSDCFNYIDHRKQFENKYHCLTNYYGQFITNEIVEQPIIFDLE